MLQVIENKKLHYSKLHYLVEVRLASITGLIFLDKSMQS